MKITSKTAKPYLFSIARQTSLFAIIIIIIPHLLLLLLRCLVLHPLLSYRLLLQLVTVDVLQYLDSRRPRLLPRRRLWVFWVMLLLCR
ncbi:hypothetical protein RchiOBHm_Chr1g0336271 [Rosa chinensis]|uniref:Uncharacterized protein n=1 Tax=Rosa chinensis TaxID=74649 RepID=A0A2P6SCL9_ROSCH|nr:hypothetical protein RchiOBHm_Chr1g0336271 [Rosa chinensis]